jgi:lactococcin 972 family bacteriocin
MKSWPAIINKCLLKIFGGLILMKKTLIALTVGALLILPAAVFAGTGDEGPKSGSLNIDGERVSGGFMAASLVTENVGGGFWAYGFYTDVFKHFSEYSHGTKVHSAAAGNYNGSVSSGWIQPGNLAQAICVDTAWGNTVNWNVQ